MEDDILLPGSHQQSIIRALTPFEDEFQKSSIDVPPTGHRCFRWDSLGSLLSIMVGLPQIQGSRWNLTQGMMAPAMATDEDIRARVYYYGTLHAASKEGSGNLSVDKLPDTQEFEYVKALLSMGVVTVIHATAYKTGPNTTKRLGQWSKSGFLPRNGYVTGVVVGGNHDKTMAAVLNAFASSDTLQAAMRAFLLSPYSFFNDHVQLHWAGHLVAGITGSHMWWALDCLVQLFKLSNVILPIPERVERILTTYLPDESWRAEPFWSAILQLAIKVSNPKWKGWRDTRTGTMYSSRYFYECKEGEPSGGRFSGWALMRNHSDVIEALLPLHEALKAVLGDSNLPMGQNIMERSAPLPGSMIFESIGLQKVKATPVEGITFTPAVLASKGFESDKLCKEAVERRLQAEEGRKYRDKEDRGGSWGSGQRATTYGEEWQEGRSGQQHSSWKSRGDTHEE